MLDVAIEGTVVRLTGEFDIYSVADQHRRLTQALEAEGVSRVDLTGVELLDGAGLQLLVWLGQQQAARGQPCALVGATGAVSAVLDFVKYPQEAARG